MTKKTLIIVPALNESKAIGSLIAEISRFHPLQHVLVIDDGSQDNTAQEAQKAGAQVVRLPFNLGIGGAVQTGFRYARDHDYDAAVQIDGDAQHDPSFLLCVLTPVLKGELDLCIGSRFLTPEPGFKSTMARRLGIRFFSVLLSALTQVPLTDPTSGFRASSRRLIECFADYYPVDFPEPEAIQTARRLGAKIGEVPVTMRSRRGGESSIRMFKTLYYMIKVTLAILIDTLKKRK
ncbi:MAG: glycosyltransferase family 2 protein [Candidatus Omnitrophica bacterium]|nr:glycosyltransferase family 2 protein [Candidatus Omnitrophota bacterium]